MASCNECIYNPKCHSRIAYGMDTEWNGTPTPDMEKRCKDFKNKADVQEVKHGEWITQNIKYNHKCSICEHSAFYSITGVLCNYCPNCGAKMDGEDNG